MICASPTCPFYTKNCIAFFCFFVVILHKIFTHTYNVTYIFATHPCSRRVGYVDIAFLVSRLECEKLQSIAIMNSCYSLVRFQVGASRTLLLRGGGGQLTLMPPLSSRPFDL